MMSSSISFIFYVTALTFYAQELVFIALSLSLLTQRMWIAVNRCPVMLSWDMTKTRFGKKVTLFVICWITSDDSEVRTFLWGALEKEIKMICKDVSPSTVYWWDCVCLRCQIPPGRIRKILSSSSHTHVLKTRPHWITSSPAPSFQSHCESEALAPLLKARIGSLASKFECAGALGGRKRAAAGTFSRWSEGWWRRARPWHGGTYAGSRGHGRQRHCLYSAPITRPQVLQALQALWGSLIAHVEPQGLMGLAVVYDRLFIAVEGQRTQLVGDLFRWTESIEEKIKECDGEDKVGVEDTWTWMYKSEGEEGTKKDREKKS